MDCSDVANEEISQSSGCTTEPVAENQNAESILPVSISFQCALISPRRAFSISRSKEDPKAMLYFSGFEGCDQFSVFSNITIYNVNQLRV